MMVIVLVVLFSVVFVLWFIFKHDGSRVENQPISYYAVPDDALVKEHQYFCTKDSGTYISVWPKNRKLGDHLEFNIAGIAFRGNMMSYLGEYVGKLVEEPDNEYDANAIKVLAHDGHHVGYVPKDMTEGVREVATLPCACYIYIGAYQNEDGMHFYSCCYITL